MCVEYQAVDLNLWSILTCVMWQETVHVVHNIDDELTYLVLFQLFYFIHLFHQCTHPDFNLTLISSN